MTDNNKNNKLLNELFDDLTKSLIAAIEQANEKAKKILETATKEDLLDVEKRESLLDLAAFISTNNKLKEAFKCSYQRFSTKEGSETTPTSGKIGFLAEAA